MTETEVIYQLPTSVLKDKAQSLAGSFYNFLLLHLNIILLIVGIIILFFVIRFCKNLYLSILAKKRKPESTNTWFDWKEFREWQEKQKR